MIKDWKDCPYWSLDYDRNCCDHPNSISGTCFFNYGCIFEQTDLDEKEEGNHGKNCG